ncbi:MAG: hypothetical protein SFY81_04780 [Verrucomicrobiota bacterium]|nr:hypothetical protein [Verrucomicrobiota bacterium]
MTTIAHSPFWTPLFALDRLNSWVRARNQRAWLLQSKLEPVIYWTKTKAILSASKQWQINLRRVAVKKPCRVCGGTGTWVSDRAYWYSNEEYEDCLLNYGETCRKCNGSGTVLLRFVETTIGPIRWHTPSERWDASSLDVYVPFPGHAYKGAEFFEVSTDWEPNRPGKPLSVKEVERDMLVLLKAFPKDVCFALEFHHRIDVLKAKAFILQICA